MPIYQYKAKNKTGDTLAGTVEAASEISAQEALEEKGLFVIALDQKKTGSFLENPIHVFNKIPNREIVIFLRQLSVMIEANVPIVRTLKSLSEQTKREDFKLIIIDLAEEVNSGVKFSKALERYPKVFDNFFVNMVRSGETTGKLDEVLTYLADQKEKDYDIGNQIRGAMIYPVFVIVGLFVVGIIMMTFVVPKLTKILVDSGQTLPLATRILIGTSNFLVNYWWLVILLVVSLVIAFIALRRTKEGKLQLDFLLLKIPVFGNIYKKIYLSRFCQSLSTLLASGVPLTDSLNITGDIIGNDYYRHVIEETKAAVIGGKSITTVFKSDKQVPSMVSQMLAVGEETGRMDQILAKLGEFYTKEVTTLVRSLINLIEPIIIILLGIAVSMLIVAILLPMYNLTSLF